MLKQDRLQSFFLDGLRDALTHTFGHCFLHVAPIAADRSLNDESGVSETSVRGATAHHCTECLDGFYDFQTRKERHEMVQHDEGDWHKVRPAVFLDVSLESFDCLLSVTQEDHLVSLEVERVLEEVL